MDEFTRTTTAIFARPFRVPGFDETLPAGEYKIETELASPPDLLHAEAWKASVKVILHPRDSHPGLARTLTVSLADLDEARAKDKLTGMELADFFLEEMLDDPMVRLVMQADGVSEVQLRQLYSGARVSQMTSDVQRHDNDSKRSKDNSSIEAAENEGMPTTAD